MRRAFASGLAVLFAAGMAGGQQSAPPVPAPSLNELPAAPTVYYDVQGVTAPEWMRPPFPASSLRHCQQLAGTIWLTAVIDASGIPREIHWLKTEGDNLDSYALGLIAAQRFKPGTYNSVPAPVAVILTTSLHLCARHLKNGNLDLSNLSIISVPSIAIGILAPPQEQAKQAPAPATESGPSVYRVGGRISAPIVIHSVEAEFSDYARRKGIDGVCIISAIVDVNGLPQQVHVVRSLEPSLDRNAVDAVKQYLFKPAMKDGVTPVPVMITIEVDYRLGHR